MPKEHLRVITPLPKVPRKNVQVIREEIAHPGLSVIVAVRECLEEAEEEEQEGAMSRGRKQDIILAGVGGQGILSIAFVIDNAALKEGFHIKQAEVHGMAQRGGAVQSHLRLSTDRIWSDLIPRGRAD